MSSKAIPCSIRVGIHILTICAPDEGKIMRCRSVTERVVPGDGVVEVTGVGTPTWELFIAYRRADAPGHAGRIGERLIANFGPGQVFKDIESLPPGVDFVDVVRDRLQRAVVMIVIIGPRWLDGRLHDPNDLHREEIRTALERNLVTIPVLVGGAHFPSRGDLPEDIQSLTRRQGLEVADTRWDYDIGKLSEAIVVGLSQSPKRQRFLAQFKPEWPDGPQWHWVTDNPTDSDLE